MKRVALSIQRLINSADLRGRLAHQGQRDELVHFARQVKEAADEAWDELSKARQRNDDLSAGYWDGRASALCEILGDQVALSRDEVL